MRKDICIMGNKGFHLNIGEYTFSIQIGGENYSDNYDSVEIGTEKDIYRLESDEAEVAVWLKDEPNRWVTGDFFSECNLEDVAGYRKMPEILKAFKKAMNAPNPKTN